MAYVHKATYYYDVSNDLDTVEVSYSRYIVGVGWKMHTDFFSSYPLGDWHLLDFTKNGNFPDYMGFLNTMVYKNQEVQRKIAKVSLDLVIEKYEGTTDETNKFIRIMNNIKILDPTFVPPYLNTKCKWQIEMLRELATVTSYT